ncbi:hypothetical protein MPTK1_7g09300 [Marchantia polymorpha subsp. ruderalis]|uniref:Uncharacterized protein n=2 Tax=Marchantia polymorpha TaxID=3197 RepID=A0AAF6BXQ7_MARPO|nr:hypothetical protein MARPO_0068s0083 [Marchantia polymorpha]BBN16791.1 hypothetical protein Mp_7g09300 [Marchantia polymorpha subsp. ruderalis]|eukprot:PTQ35874.1 hypothetical protein MARPO_0068s0083 [Marchantia polymorpha]
MDFTQCISPTLQDDAWVEQQQQVALWDQHLLFLREQQLCLWGQNESELQYLYECDPSYRYCSSVGSSRPPTRRMGSYSSKNSSRIHSLQSFDDYDKEAQFMLDSWISCSGCKVFSLPLQLQILTLLLTWL